MGATVCGEVWDDDKEEDLEDCLGDRGTPLHIAYKKKDITDVKKCEINVTVVNGQKIKCKIKGWVNMKIQGK